MNFTKTTLALACLPLMAFAGPDKKVEPLMDIYPYKPYETSLIQESVSKLMENEPFISNINEMDILNLKKRNAKQQPWAGHYWALNNGMIANRYHEPLAGINPTNFVWQWNVKQYEKQKEDQALFYDLSQKRIDHLSPAEKYDLLMGDKSFNLTNRIWDYTKQVGSAEKQNFITAIDLPEGYRLPKKDTWLSLWEGICHGWALGSGYSVRPEKTVVVNLPNGKKLPFYPDDIKALTSLMWAHSNIQGNILMEGRRCNKKNPPQDKFGRYIDVEPDLNEETVEPKCADVHPAIFHVAMLNIMGIEERAFVLDHNPGAAVSNQPVAGYEFEYFHPKTGKEGTLAQSMVSRASLGEGDLFKITRNPEATHIVGISMNVKYVNWVFPKKKKTDSPAEDQLVDMRFNYDLELDAQGNIVGGQWRIRKNGKDGIGQKPNMPDFFWLPPRDWKPFFEGNKNLPEWDFESSNLPPEEFKRAAGYYHNAVLINRTKCAVYPEGGGPKLMVDCTFKEPKPQPLVNVVQKLLELSQK